MQNKEREALKKERQKEWQKEWNEKGEKYAKAVNDMVAFAEAHGLDAYKGEEPVDERECMTQLCKAVFELLKEANERGETEKFRADFPPSNIIFSEGERLGGIGAQSAYPHFCLFSADDTQLITNSCHFYNGVTIGVDRALLKRGLEVGFYDPDGGDEQNFTLIDDAMRVYAGVATGDFYILGDAYGYIRAVGKDGRKIWRHYLGGTIKSMAISEDGGVLFVGTYGGRLHKLRLGAGQDSHTIGNGNHKEEFRLIAYEDKIYRW